ncbi:MAG TPA: hypothetical protein VMU66_02415, partial [Gaiellales bacterium]|nr:hypothetical protein [Gaiellales bacterium]
MKLVLISAIAVSAAVGAGVSGVVVSTTGGTSAGTTVVTRQVTQVQASPASFGGSGQSITQIYKRAVPAVVEIKVVTSTGSSGGGFGTPFGQQVAQVQGTGFVIDSRGDIVTNEHVVAGARSVQVTTNDGSVYS